LVYPDFFGWTRPMYPILIVIFSWFGLSLFSAAHTINVIAGLLSILAVYALVSEVLKSKKSGLMAALLLALSYNHAVWGGFVLTESLGVLMLSLALWVLWRGKGNKDEWFTKYDIVTGLVFALAILTRYEYIVLLAPAALLAGKKRAASIFGTALLVATIKLAILHPFSGGWSWVWEQINDYIYLLLFVLAATGITYFAISRQKAKRSKFLEQWAAKFALACLALAFLVVIVFNLTFPALRTFANNDPLLTYSAFAGLVLLLTGKKSERRLGLLLFVGLLILSAVYYHLNPAMDRYITHMLPLLLVAAGYGILAITNFQKNRVMLVLLGLFLSLQFAKTWNGLHNVNNGIWFRPGYEEKSAKILNSMLAANKGSTLGCSARRQGGTDRTVQNGTEREYRSGQRSNAPRVNGAADSAGRQVDAAECLLIASMPEPYYLFTNNPTQSVADTQPYIFVKLPDSIQLVIVDDEAMRTIFPNFHKFIQKNLGAYQTSQYSVGEPLRYITSIYQEQQPVKIYQIKYSDFQKLLPSTSTAHRLLGNETLAQR
jgi:hypothetical protein